MGDYRHRNDQGLPPRYGNSPGADYFGGVSQIYAADGSQLYGYIKPNGERVYNLDAQVAAHHRISELLADPHVPRTTGANSYADTIANRHDIQCWYAADTRDRMLQGHKEFEKPGQPGEYRTWAELSFWEQSTSKVAIAAQDKYHSIRAQAEIEFMHGLQDWKPEGAVAQYYKQKGMVGFEYLAGSYPEPYRTQMLGELPALRDKGGGVDFNPVSSIGHAIGATGLKNTDFEKFSTLPLSDRERDFFHPSMESLRKYGAPVWEPNPNHPANQLGAMEHGRFKLSYTDEQGRQVEKVLDMDQGRRFTTTVTNPANGQLLEKETRTPTSPLVKENYYTPSYVVEKTDAQGRISQTTLAAGRSDYPSVENSALYKESQGNLKERHQELKSDPKRSTVIDTVKEDIDAQRTQAQQNYLSKDHPLYLDVKPQPQKAKLPPQEPKPSQDQATPQQVQHLTDAPPSITPSSSQSDKFKALMGAIHRNDDQAVSQIAQAHAASAQGQAFFQEGRAHNQAIAEQQAQAQQQAVQQQETQQQRGPVMRM